MKYNDSDIISIFFTEKGNRKASYLKIIQNNTAIQEYLENRFPKYLDYNEVLWRIKLGYDEIPICPICKEKEIRFIGKIQVGFAQTCCKSCQTKLWKKNQETTCIEKYGVKNVFQSSIIKKKIKETNLNKYGVICTLQVPEFREKGKQTCIKKFGLCNGGGAPEILEKIKSQHFEKYGVCYPAQREEVIKKVHKTKKLKGSYKKSKEEDLVYNELLKVFGSTDIIRQYTSDLYPFNCDFYIHSLNLYIECNFHWTHGKHPYNPNNKKDVELLEKWKSKNTTYYNSAINVWSIRDPLKVETTIKNKLNYKTFYSISEFYSFISLLINTKNLI